MKILQWMSRDEDVTGEQLSGTNTFCIGGEFVDLHRKCKIAKGHKRLLIP
jgi:hypothetical protein